MVTLRFGEDKHHLHTEMMQWAVDNFGKGTYHGVYDDSATWSVAFTFNTQTYVFVDDSQAMMFKLRWGGQQFT